MTSTVVARLATSIEKKALNEMVITRPNRKPVLDFRGSWKKASTAAGVLHLRFHDLRRTAARALRRAGVAEGVIMTIGSCRLTRQTG
jgi:integrase